MSEHGAEATASAAGALLIRVLEAGALVAEEGFDAPLVIGRQREAGERLDARTFASGRWRLALAGADEPSVAREHVLIEPMGAGKVRLTNRSENVPVAVVGGDALPPGGSSTRGLPVTLVLGRKTVEIHEGGAAAGHDAEVPIRRLDEATVAPGAFEGPGPKALPALELAGDMDCGVEVESLLKWLQAVIVVLQTANRSEDFFHTAARAIVEALGMDTGCVVVLNDGHWHTEAYHDAPGQAVSRAKGKAHHAHGNGWRPSRKLLDRMLGEKRTLWRVPEGAGSDHMSPAVAAPILDRDCRVIGALYGERRPSTRGQTPDDGFHIRKIDAMILELLASGLAAGLARLELEKAAVASRARFEQFFTPELASELAARPDLLKGREVEVTMLFCDIRGFSRVSERIGPARTVEWVSHVMGVLSDCVIDHHGVLVDYIGDELIAMWGPPKEAPDHARLACLAALAMLDRLPAINARWQPVLGEATDVGIGVNTGLAQVGNTGSARKFKYGALGNTVNLASRVQGATRYLKTRLVVTGSTRAKLDDSFTARRLGKAVVVHIAEPVELYELPAPGQPGWAAIRTAYEAALQRFEARDFRETTRILGNLLALHPDDGPSLVLIGRAVNATVEESPAFDPIWKLPGK